MSAYPIGRAVAAALSVLLLLAAMAVPVAAADIEGDQVCPPTCDIEAGDTVKGNVLVRQDATFRVYGTVNGDIDEAGSGSVYVLGGLVRGDIVERGEGGVFASSGTVMGDIHEFGDPGPFTNSVGIQVDSFVQGGIWEWGAGRVHLSGSRVQGDVNQSGDGDPATSDWVVVGFGSFLRGDVDCGGGFLIVTADSEHRGDAINC